MIKWLKDFIDDRNFYKRVIVILLQENKELRKIIKELLKIFKNML